MTPGQTSAGDGGAAAFKLAWLGMAAPYAWLGWFLTLPGGEGLPFVGRSLYPGFVLACALVFACALLAGKRPDCHASHSSRLPMVALDVLATLLLLAASLLRTLGSSVPSLVVAAALVGGFGSAWCYCRWLALFARLDLRGAISCICGSVALASVLKLVCGPLAGPALIVAGVVLALAGLPCMLACGRASAPRRADVSDASSAPGVPNALAQGRPACPAHPESPAPSHPEGRLSLDGHMRGELLGTVVCIMALSFVLGVAYNLEGANEFGGGLVRLLGFVPEALAAGLLWAWVCRKRRSLSVPGIFCVLVLVISTGLVALALLGDGASMPMFVLLNIDHSLLTMFLWVLLVDVAQRTSASPLCVAAVGWGCRSLPFVMGGVAAEALGVGLSPTVALVLVYVSLGVLAGCLLGGRVGMERMLTRLVPRANPDASQAADGTVPDKAADNLEDACDEAARRFGLTPRERQILGLLCRGRSRPYIAETLYLSENTVRNHAKHVYEKMGVHDRQSLLSLVGELQKA